ADHDGIPCCGFINKYHYTANDILRNHHRICTAVCKKYRYRYIDFGHASILHMFLHILGVDAHSMDAYRITALTERTTTLTMLIKDIKDTLRIVSFSFLS